MIDNTIRDKAQMIKMGLFYVKCLLGIVVVYAIYQIWQTYDYKVIPLDNIQMAPKFKPQKFYMGKRIDNFENLKHGDVVYYSYPHSSLEKEDSLMFARVVGLPGDQVGIRNGKLHRNGKLIEEAIEPEIMGKETFLDVMVPRDYVYLLLDNRQRPPQKIYLNDSRYLGPVLIYTLLGKFGED